MTNYNINMYANIEAYYYIEFFIYLTGPITCHIHKHCHMIDYVKGISIDRKKVYAVELSV